MVKTTNNLIPIILQNVTNSSYLSKNNNSNYADSNLDKKQVENTSEINNHDNLADKSVINKTSNKENYQKPPISELHKCTSCGKGLIRRPSKFKGFWWACSAYPTCKTTYFDQNGKPNFDSKK